MSLLTSWPISVDAIPASILDKDFVLRRSASKAGYCFALVIGQINWNTYRIRIAADTRYLHDDKRSYVVDVPATELPPQARITRISASAIPEALLSEDQTLQQAVCEYGKCFALIERQIDWDLSRVRIAPNARSLFDDEQSQVIHLSQAELRAYIRFLPEQEIQDPNVVASAPQVVSEPQESVDLALLEPVDVPEEDIKAAVETVDIPEDIPLVQLPLRRSKLWRRLQRIVELVLYRAVLRAVAHKKTLQETIRRVLVLRNQFSKRLICIRDMYEINHHTYWSVQIFLPKSLIQTSAI